MNPRIGLHLPAASHPAAPAALAGHLAQCTRARGRGHALRALSEAAHAALLPRFVSTVTALVALLALVPGIAWLAG